MPYKRNLIVDRCITTPGSDRVLIAFEVLSTQKDFFVFPNYLCHAAESGSDSEFITAGHRWVEATLTPVTMCGYVKKRLFKQAANGTLKLRPGYSWLDIPLTVVRNNPFGRPYTVECLTQATHEWLKAALWSAWMLRKIDVSLLGVPVESIETKAVRLVKDYPDLIPYVHTILMMRGCGRQIPRVKYMEAAIRDERVADFADLSKRYRDTYHNRSLLSSYIHRTFLDVVKKGSVIIEDPDAYLTWSPLLIVGDNGYASIDETNPLTLEWIVANVKLKMGRLSLATNAEGVAVLQLSLLPRQGKGYVGLLQE